MTEYTLWIYSLHKHAELSHEEIQSAQDEVNTDQ